VGTVVGATVPPVVAAGVGVDVLVSPPPEVRSPVVSCAKVVRENETIKRQQRKAREHTRIETIV